MTKNGTRRLEAWAFATAFAAFSVAMALGWLYRPDLWALQMAQEYPLGFLDTASGVFSLPGGMEVAGAVFSCCSRRCFCAADGCSRDVLW